MVDSKFWIGCSYFMNNKIDLDCKYSNCYVTNDTNYFGKGQTDNFDAIIFGLPIKMSDEVNYSKKIVSYYYYH